MNRYNLFQKIHQGLKASLSETGRLLQHTDFLKGEEADKALGRGQFAIALFERCRQAEEACVLPLIGVYEPGVADAFEQDHKAAYRMVKKMEALAEAFTNASLPEQTSLGKKIAAQFEAFYHFNILHMTREEQVAGKLLWRYCSDAELQTMAAKLMGNTEALLANSSGRLLFNTPNGNGMTSLSETWNAAPEMTFHPVQKAAGNGLHARNWNLMRDVVASGRFLAN